MSSRIECKCGNIVTIGSFPNEGVFRLVSEEDYDEVVDPFDRMKAERLFLGGSKIIECDKCGRMIFQDGHGIKYYSIDGL
jgi:hypothetical protein